MLKFYFLHFLDRPDTIVANGSYDRARYLKIVSIERVDDWTAPLFRFPDTPVPDYLANSSSLRLVSSKLRGLIEGLVSPDDVVEWLPARVIVESTEAEVEFHVVRPATPTDVFDLAVSKSGPQPGSIRVPALRASIVEGHDLIGMPGEILRTIISERLLKAMSDSGCTGFETSPVRVVATS